MSEEGKFREDKIDVNRVYGSFYKYRRIGPEGPEGEKPRETLRQIIVDNQIYFTKPSKLNDPHDCRPATTKPTAGELRKHARKVRRSVVKRYGLKLSVREAHSKDTEIVRKLSTPAGRNASVFRVIDDNLGVFCTSKKPNSSTQWTYYADSHMGVCLEFTVQSTSPVFAMPIRYTNKRPLIDVIKLRADSWYRKKHVNIVVTTKSRSWEKESEVRFVRNGSGLFRYNPVMLTKVIFGLDTPAEYEDFVLNLLREAGKKPIVEKCRAYDFGYKLHFDPVSTQP